MTGWLFYLCLLFSNTFIEKENIVLTKGNHFFITDTINQDSKEFFIAGTRLLTEKNIYIYINSNGGSIMDGNDIIESINFLHNSGYKVHCIAQKAYSMAFHILQHCPVRMITDTSSVMQHQMKLGIYDSYENIKSYLAMIEQINQHHIHHSAQRLNMTTEEFTQKINHDWWIYGSNIIELGMADRIVSVGCHKELFDVTYRKPKQSSSLNELLSSDSTQSIIELSGCPLLH